MREKLVDKRDQKERWRFCSHRKRAGEKEREQESEREERNSETRVVGTPYWMTPKAIQTARNA